MSEENAFFVGPPPKWRNTRWSGRSLDRTATPTRDADAGEAEQHHGPGRGLGNAAGGNDVIGGEAGLVVDIVDLAQIVAELGIQVVSAQVGEEQIGARTRGHAECRGCRHGRLIARPEAVRHPGQEPLVSMVPKAPIRLFTTLLVSVV